MYKVSPLVFLSDLDSLRLSQSPTGPVHSIVLPCKKSEAFGDGSHPTTRLCAGAVDFFCRTQTPRAFLDVGTGTGILARIARARGVEHVVATDIDPVALESANSNCLLDPGPKIQVCSDLPDHWGDVFDLVVANILQEPLVLLRSHFLGALKASGTLMVSGFTRAQVPHLSIQFEQSGFYVAGQSVLEEWVLLILKKRTP